MSLDTSKTLTAVTYNGTSIPVSGGSAPSNMVTTDTDQTISGIKNFESVIKVPIYSSLPDHADHCIISTNNVDGYLGRGLKYNKAGGIKLDSDSSLIFRYNGSYILALGNGSDFNPALYPQSGDTSLGYGFAALPQYDFKNGYFTGTLRAANLSDGTTTKSVTEVLRGANIPSAPTTDGNFVLKCAVASGVATYTWVAE